MLSTNIAFAKVDIRDLNSELISKRTWTYPLTYCITLLLKLPFTSILIPLDNHGARNKLALVQYMFDGPEIEVITKPHGNSKGSTPYFRTSDSARQKLQTLAGTKTPKAVVSLKKLVVKSTLKLRVMPLEIDNKSVIFAVVQLDEIRMCCIL